MTYSPSTWKKGVAHFILLLVFTTSSGCTSLGMSSRALSPAYRASGYYFATPLPFCPQGEGEKNVYCAPGAGATATDSQVMAYADEIKATMRERMNNSRFVRQSGGTIQVLAAASAGLLAGVSSAAAVEAIATLSGVSAVVPQLSGVFGTNERAALFAQGAAAIDSAQAVYLGKRAGQSGEVIPSGELTQPGAELYAAVAAAIHAVEAGLTGILPNASAIQQQAKQLEDELKLARPNPPPAPQPSAVAPLR